ncbi:MAG: hypothetical protein ACJAQ6_000220 [Arenicella sp.]|jgi:hypothetical protein
MSNTDNAAFVFFAWWKQGLLNPLPKRQALETVLSVVDKLLCDASGRALSQSEIDQIKIDQCNRGAEIYLLAPTEKVMSRRISDPQKGLPLSLIAEEVLPFEASELIIALGADEKHIHAIVKSELSTQLTVFAANDVLYSGVAFDLAERLVFAQQSTGPMPISRPVSKAWVTVIMLIVTSLAASMLFVSHSERQKRAVLSQQLKQLRLQTGGVIVDRRQANSLIAQIQPRGAEQVALTLTSVADALTESAIIDQLILSGNQVVIDASAENAIQVQANLDALGAFESTEFVTSISRSPSQNQERFRLKATIRERR